MIGLCGLLCVISLLSQLVQSGVASGSDFDHEFACTPTRFSSPADLRARLADGCNTKPIESIFPSPISPNCSAWSKAMLDVLVTQWSWSQDVLRSVPSVLLAELEADVVSAVLRRLDSKLHCDDSMKVSSSTDQKLQPLTTFGQSVVEDDELTEASTASELAPLAASDPDDCRALWDFYESTNGPQWKVPYGFNLGESAVLANCCTVVQGIICDSTGRITDFLMTANLISGSFPPSFARFTHLQFIALENNMLTGPIPLFFCHFEQLKSIRLSGNRLTGSIPPCIGGLTQLITLQLGENQLTGMIPASLGQLSSLTLMRVQSNRLSSEIPAALLNSSSLQWLDLSSNQMHGEIPDSFSPASVLRRLDFQNNQLSGRIPPSLGFVSQLNTLDISSNMLSGEIPPSIGGLTVLFSIDLSYNQLSGPLPASLGQLSHLRSLRLSSNSLTGRIPESLGNATTLLFLDISSNLLSNTIPASLCKVSLTELKLASNNLRGELPPCLFQLHGLQTLDLHANSLSGPLLLDTLTASLKTLNLQRNWLSGPIPLAFCNSSLQYVYLANNYFSSFPQCAFPKTITLQLSSNLFSNFPFSLIGNFSSLASLDLSHNNLTGDFPVRLFMGGLPLRTLSLAHNQFNGWLPIYPCGYAEPSTGEVIPFDSFTALNSLDLSGNNIRGSFGRYVTFTALCPYCNVQYSSLTTLILSQCSIGSTSPAVAGQSCNSPSHPFPLIFDLLPGLTYLDLSYNNVSDRLDTLFDGLPLLTYTNLEGNELANVHESLGPSNQDIFSFDSSSAYPLSSNMTCYVASTFDGRLTVQVDPLFFGYSNCVCRPGFYGKPPHCRPCLSEHASCSFSSDSLPFSLDPAVAWNVSGMVVANAGYYASPHVSYDDMYFDRSYPKSVELCANAGTDLTPCKPSLGRPCADGYEGRLCAHCASGYFATGDRCDSCPTGVSLVLFAILSIVVWVAFVVWSFFVGASASGLTKILVFFFQALFFIRAPMSSGLYGATHTVASLAMLSPAGPECFSSSWTFQSSYILSLVAAVAFPVLSAIIWLVGTVFLKGTGKWSVDGAKQWLDRCRRSALFMSVFLYMPTVRMVLSALVCTRDSGDGLEYLVAVPYYRCSDSLRAMSVMLSIVYVVGAPLAASVLLLRSRAAKEDPQSSSRRRYVYSMLFGVYAPSCFMWELVITVRRVLFVSAFAMVESRSSLQTLLVIVVLGGSLLLQGIYQPLRTRVEHAAELLSLVVLLINYGLQMKGQALGALDVDSAGVLVFVLNVFTVLLLLIALVKVQGGTVLRLLTSLTRSLIGGKQSSGASSRTSELESNLLESHSNDDL
jgi:Leucine-rich repeat (LRR) protein